MLASLSFKPVLLKQTKQEEDNNKNGLDASPFDFVENECAEAFRQAAQALPMVDGTVDGSAFSSMNNSPATPGTPISSDTNSSHNKLPKIKIKVPTAWSQTSWTKLVYFIISLDVVQTLQNSWVETLDSYVELLEEHKKQSRPFTYGKCVFHVITLIQWMLPSQSSIN